jgi:hypothetical protein
MGTVLKITPRLSATNGTWRALRQPSCWGQLSNGATVITGRLVRLPTLYARRVSGENHLNGSAPAR